jgi:hypothetical protein
MRGIASFIVAVSFVAASAHADPQAAALNLRRPIEAACTASAPSVGERFEGTVLQVIDGQTLCVARGPMPSDWIRVRVAGAARASPRSALMAATFGAEIVCTPLDATSAGGVEARCEKDGVALDRLLTTDEVRREAASWR